jgi:hypothetical protein
VPPYEIYVPPAHFNFSSECDLAYSTGGCTDSYRGGNRSTKGIRGRGLVLVLVHVLGGSLSLVLLLLLGGLLSASTINSGLLFGTYGHGLIASTKDV